MSNMVVRTNIMSLNSHRNMGMTGTAQARASARLSSGFRINSAADDAAGLAISEKMRGQIRGLDQASRNAQDGISLIQTAEGAMQTINDMVIRIRELVIQAANDTNVHEDARPELSDRVQIQREIDQLLDEIDAVTVRTEFNTRVLLDGTWSADPTGAGGGGRFSVLQDRAATQFLAEAPNQANLDIILGSRARAATFNPDGTVNVPAGPGYIESLENLVARNQQILNDLREAEVRFGDANMVLEARNAVTAALAGLSDALSDAPFTLAQANAWLEGELGTGVAFSDADALDAFLVAGTVSDDMRDAFRAAELARTPLQIAPATLDNTRETGYIVPARANAANLAAITAAVANLQTVIDGNITALATAHQTYRDAIADLQTALDTLQAYEGTAAREQLAGDMAGVTVEMLVSRALGQVGGGAAGGGNSLWFQIGANEGQGISVNIEAVDSFALGIDGFRSGGAQTIEVEPGQNLGSEGLLTMLDEALAVVTGQRAILGAVQNRLEFTIENLDTASENLQAANSRIRDADMAREMMRLTQMNVLQQAAISMLAQANQAPQNILQLLR